MSLFTTTLNEVIDLHTSRKVNALQYRIPDGIWAGLTLLTLMSMFGVGYRFGTAGWRSVLPRLFVAVSFALVVWLIADLDRVSGGMVVSQQPLLDLAAEIGAPVR